MRDDFDDLEALGSRGKSSAGLAETFAQVIENLLRLLRGEIALARAEAADALKSLAKALAALAVAGILALIALNVLAAALVEGLIALGLGKFWSTALICALFALAALGLLLWGLKLIERVDFMPRRSLDGLRKDVETLVTPASTGGRGEYDEI